MLICLSEMFIVPIHSDSDSTIEDIKIHVLDICLGKVAPRTIGYNMPAASPAPESSASPAKPTLAVSSQKPGLAPLKVDAGPKAAPMIGSDTPNSSFSAASPIASPISPPSQEAAYSRFAVLRPKRSGTHLPSSVAPDNVEQSEDSGDDHNNTWPVFASADGELEYEYQSDLSIDYTLLDAPPDPQHSPSATQASPSLADIQGAFNPLGVRKSSSRVAFQASLGAQVQRYGYNQSEFTVTTH